MPITQLLENNAQKYGDEIALVEINPEVQEVRRVTWKEYELIEAGSTETYRREITWSVFNEKANRCANLLLSRGIKKGDKVGILLMNGLEWLPVYFGILKTGALAVPLNYRYTSSEIKYCLDLADINALVFFIEYFNILLTRLLITRDIFLPSAIIYNSFDVTSMLASDNAIGVTLGNGKFYTARQNYKPYKTPTFGYPKLRLNLIVEFTDGTRQTISSDEKWKLTSDGPIRSNNEYDGEEYDVGRNAIPLGV